MAKIAQLVEGNYNILDNIPVINQDLSASGFTPVANTYYRHTGATTDTFTQGVIYLYDTAYHKLGESGGGTTLNRYEFTVTSKPTLEQAEKILNILNNAVRILNVEIRVESGLNLFMTQALTTYQWQGRSIKGYSDTYLVYSVLIRPDLGASGINANKTEFKNSSFSTNSVTMGEVKITYLNDTEIT